MCGFYRKHIPNFSKIASPLYNLTKKHVEFLWTPECQNSFETLKFTLTTTQVLVKAGVTQPLLVTTDASSTRVGGVFSQVHPDGNNKPLGY